MRKFTCSVVDDRPLVCTAVSMILSECKSIDNVTTCNTFREGLNVLKIAKAYGFNGKIIFMSAVIE